MHRAEGHDVDRLFEVLQAGVLQGHDLDDSSDGDRHLDRADLGLDPADHLGDRLSLADLADIGQHPFPGRVEQLGGLVQLLTITGTDHNRVVAVPQLAGDEEAQPS